MDRRTPALRVNTPPGTCAPGGVFAGGSRRLWRRELVLPLREPGCQQSPGSLRSAYSPSPEPLLPRGLLTFVVTVRVLLVLRTSNGAMTVAVHLMFVA